MSFASLLASREPEPVLALDPDALAALPYSSGSVGAAKGVILTHRTIVSNLCQTIQAFPMTKADVVLAVLPMFHIFGFNVMTLCRLATGGTLVTLPRFEPQAFLTAIERYHVTHVGLLPRCCSS
jgi:acyl-CoA synthetase (AMP-forming)/AMP-acid ligase II